MDNMELTAAEFKQFKKLYEDTKAKDGRDGTFTFKGHEFLVSYVGYLLEYLEGQDAKKH